MGKLIINEKVNEAKTLRDLEIGDMFKSDNGSNCIVMGESAGLADTIDIGTRTTCKIVARLDDFCVSYMNKERLVYPINGELNIFN